MVSDQVAEVDEPHYPESDLRPDTPRVTPLARKVAEMSGINLQNIQGTGPGGKIVRMDVLAHAQTDLQPAISSPHLASETPMPQPTAAALPTSREKVVLSSQTISGHGRTEERIRMTRRRQTIARRLVEAQHTAAMLTTFNEIDMSAVIDIRKRKREWFKKRYEVDLGFMSFFVKAAISALREFPMVNAEIQEDEIVLKKYYDIGIAVGASEGLVVPVLRDADQMSFADIERSIKRLAEKAQSGTLNLEDLRGGTFTITNGGIYGSMMSTPILNPPQVGILGMHRIQERPMAVNDQIVIRPMMYVALSYDHRIIDGREAVQFLVRIKEFIEDPTSMLIDS